LLEDFVEAVRTDRDPICTGAEARKSVALVCAIYEAAKSGKWVIPDA
jgi:predicted dehydrogenase